MINMILKQAYVSFKGYCQRTVREGKSFRKWFTTLEMLDREGENLRKEFQLRSLQQIILHANKNISFWQKRFKQYGLDPYHVKSVEELKKLPLLTKQDVRENLSHMLSGKIPKIFLSKGLTSGTTGTPGVFFRDLRSVSFENALLWLLRRKVGMEPGCRLVWLRGDIIVPAERRTPPFWLNNYGENQLKVSTYHLSPKYEEAILDSITSFKPYGAFAYPSAVYVLARWCQRLGRMLPFENLHTSSEAVLDEQRRLITSCLSGKWLDHYGQAERVNLIARIDSDEYREYTEYAVTELLPSEGGGGELIGSTLHNYAMPLFRYKTGDIVEGRREDGENRPIILGLSGRKEDFVVLADGSMVGRLDLVLKGLENVEEGQIHQLADQRIVIKIVKNNNYSDKDEKKLLHNARERLGACTPIAIEYVESIPRMKNGKFKFVISDCTNNANLYSRNSA